MVGKRSCALPRAQSRDGCNRKISSINLREIDRDLCREQLFGIVHLLPISDRFCH